MDRGPKFALLLVLVYVVNSQMPEIDSSSNQDITNLDDAHLMTTEAPINVNSTEISTDRNTTTETPNDDYMTTDIPSNVSSTTEVPFDGNSTTTEVLNETKTEASIELNYTTNKTPTTTEGSVTDAPIETTGALIEPNSTTKKVLISTHFTFTKASTIGNSTNEMLTNAKSASIEEPKSKNPMTVEPPTGDYFTTEAPIETITEALIERNSTAKKVLTNTHFSFTKIPTIGNSTNEILTNTKSTTIEVPNLMTTEVSINNYSKTETPIETTTEALIERISATKKVLFNTHLAITKEPIMENSTNQVLTNAKSMTIEVASLMTTEAAIGNYSTTDTPIETTEALPERNYSTKKVLFSQHRESTIENSTNEMLTNEVAYLMTTETPIGNYSTTDTPIERTEALIERHSSNKKVLISSHFAITKAQTIGNATNEVLTNPKSTTIEAPNGKISISMKTPTGDYSTTVAPTDVNKVEILTSENSTDAQRGISTTDAPSGENITTEVPIYGNSTTNTLADAVNNTEVLTDYDSTVTDALINDDSKEEVPIDDSTTTTEAPIGEYTTTSAPTGVDSTTKGEPFGEYSTTKVLTDANFIPTETPINRNSTTSEPDVPNSTTDTMVDVISTINVLTGVNITTEVLTGINSTSDILTDANAARVDEPTTKAPIDRNSTTNSSIGSNATVTDSSIVTASKLPEVPTDGNAIEAPINKKLLLSRQPATSWKLWRRSVTTMK